MKIKIDVVVYGIEPNNSTRIFRNENTIGYCFVNNGNTPVQINNFTLLPNSVWKTFEPNCEDQTVYRATFKQSNNLYTSCGTNNSILTVIIYSKVI
jgi:hypothetical protein